MPRRESAVGGGRSRDGHQAEIVDRLAVVKLFSYFNEKEATSTGGMVLQIENCIINTTGKTVAFRVWQRCVIRR
jgi:hypothetical protein